MSARIQTITELAAELDKALVQHTEADLAAIAASRARDDVQDERAHAEMDRLSKCQTLLIKAICRARATTRDEAITQLMVAMSLTGQISEGGRRKNAAYARSAVASARITTGASSPLAPCTVITRTSLAPWPGSRWTSTVPRENQARKRSSDAISLRSNSSAL